MAPISSGTLAIGRARTLFDRIGTPARVCPFAAGAAVATWPCSRSSGAHHPASAALPRDPAGGVRLVRLARAGRELGPAELPPVRPVRPAAWALRARRRSRWTAELPEPAALPASLRPAPVAAAAGGGAAGHGVAGRLPDAGLVHRLDRLSPAGPGNGRDPGRDHRADRPRRTRQQLRRPGARHPAAGLDPAAPAPARAGEVRRPYRPAPGRRLHRHRHRAEADQPVPAARPRRLRRPAPPCAACPIPSGPPA